MISAVIALYCICPALKAKSHFHPVDFFSFPIFCKQNVLTRQLEQKQSIHQLFPYSLCWTHCWGTFFKKKKTASTTDASTRTLVWRCRTPRVTWWCCSLKSPRSASVASTTLHAARPSSRARRAWRCSPSSASSAPSPVRSRRTPRPKWLRALMTTPLVSIMTPEQQSEQQGALILAFFFFLHWVISGLENVLSMCTIKSCGDDWRWGFSACDGQDWKKQLSCLLL